MNIKQLVEQSYKIAVDHGWWGIEGSLTPPNVPEKLALMHSEISEALEEWRDGGRMDEIREDENGKPCGFVVELADVMIRIADFCGRYKLPLEDALEVKTIYNKTRPYRHGGKRA